MSRIFVDFTNGAIGTAQTKYHGGGDFCRMILKELMDCRQTTYDIICLIKEGYKTSNEDENELLRTVHVRKIASLSEVDYQEQDILFLPIIDCFQINIIKIIRSNHPKLRVYCVLHGLRLIDVSKYDKYDKYYYDGIRSIGLYTYLRRKAAAIISKYYLKKYIPMYDRVYTVSNNSMQSIVRYCSPKFIKYFYRDIIRNLYEDNQNFDIKDCGYALFVNGNRYEKNLIRTLIAFAQYISESNSKLKLHVTGVSEYFEQKIQHIPEINLETIKTHVVFHDYLSYQELSKLYNNCSFLLYTSKSEGFGLPPLEALSRYKPTVASMLTSIPEVLGFSAYYVDPYDIASIKTGIAFMDNDNNRKIYTERLESISKCIRERGRMEITSFVSELMEN